jgi:hypothetical protein
VGRKVDIFLVIQQAWNRTRKLCFQPFRLNSWLVIGFCAWLSTFAFGSYYAGGINFSGGFPSFNPPAANSTSCERTASSEQVTSAAEKNKLVAGTPPECKQEVCPLPAEQIKPAAVSQTTGSCLPAIIAVCMAAAGIAIVALFVALILLSVWIGCRGAYMFLEAVLTNPQSLKGTWTRNNHRGSALFWFLFKINLVFLAAMLLAGGIGIGSGFLLGWWSIPVIVMIVLAFMLAGLGYSLFLVALNDFVVPFTYLKNVSLHPALSAVWQLHAQNKMTFFTYYIAKFILVLGIQTALGFLVCLTCCLFGCLQMIPFIGTVVLLPVYIFARSFPLAFLAQLNPEEFTFFTE